MMITHTIMIKTELYILVAIILLIIWSLVWKGIALWKSARNQQKIWFIIFLVVSTLGILEMVYIAFFQKNKNLLNKKSKKKK